MRRSLTRLCMLVLIGLILAPTAWSIPVQPVAAAPQQASRPAAVTYTPLPALAESEPNDTVTTESDESDPIGPTNPGPDLLNWSRVVTGTLGRTGDVDYYSLEVPPASTIAISLTNLPADYDLVLASASTGEEDGLNGLGNIIDTGGSIAAIGGSIAAIGGSIAAIGGSIAAIGGSIAAIGGSIAAIGGSIAAISANTGTTSESLESFLWQPGKYYIVVSSSDGASNTRPYSLEIRLASGTLAKPPAPPEVRFNAVQNGANIQTLYLVNRSRMIELYPGQTAAIAQVLGAVDQLAAAGNGVVVDVSTLVASPTTTETITAIYDRWDANSGNPLEANRIARFINNIVKAATRQNPSGPNPAYSADAVGLLAAQTNGELTQGPLPVPLPNLRNLVLVGGDPIFPFFRAPDLTTIANEGEYAAYLKQVDAGGVIDSATALGAALAYRTILTDNFYGAGRPYRFVGSPLFIPRLAVGRLVETPQDIYSYLKPYVVTNPECATPPCQPLVDMTDVQRVDRAGFVAGYDFLTDMGGSVAQQIGSYGLPRVQTLINDDWTATDLTNEWFDGRYNDFTGRATYTTSGTFGLNSVNAHFDHWRIIPASTTAGYVDALSLYTPQVDTGLNRSPFFARKLVTSVGCHSGFNVIDESVLSSTPNRQTYQADFPQAMLKQGAVYVGNTGYGYGSLDGIDYSERLADLFYEEIGRDVRGARNLYVGAEIGRALMIAKQRYLRNATSLSVYDAKALQVMTLFGLPFTRVKVPLPQLPPPEERSDAPALRLTPLTPVGPLGSYERIMTFTLQIGNQSLSRRGGANIGSVPTIQSISVQDNFITSSRTTTPTIRIFQANQIGRPTLPQFAYDITAISVLSPTQQLLVRDVSFLGGLYGSVADYDPVITQVTTETSSILSRTSIEPAFTAGANIWYPDRFYGSTSVGEGSDNRDQLVVSAAQFRADPDGQGGLMRPYRQMVFRIRYTDPLASNAQPAVDDTSAPIIDAVTLYERRTPTLQQTTTGASQIEVKVRDGDGETGVSGVEALYVLKVGNDDTWQRVVLVQDTDTNGSIQRWIATIPVPPEAARVIVTATDKAGNATTYTAKGTFAPPIGRTVYAPMIWR
jgi:hypothetical protein